MDLCDVSLRSKIYRELASAWSKHQTFEAWLWKRKLRVGVVLDFWRRSEEGGLEYALLREPCFEHLQTMCEEEDEDSEVILSSDDTTQVGAIHSMLSRTYSTYR